MALAMPKKSTIALLIILSLAIVSYTADVSISTYRYPAYHGVVFDNTGLFDIQINGFFVAQWDINPTADCEFINMTCYTQITEGHWYFNITLIATRSLDVGEPAHLFNVTVLWSPALLTYIKMNSIIFNMRPGLVGWVTLIFDTGTDNFETPVGIVIIVEQIYP